MSGNLKEKTGYLLKSTLTGLFAVIVFVLIVYILGGSNSITTNGGSECEEERARLENRIEELESELEEVTDNLEEANSNISEAKDYAWDDYNSMGDALDNLEEVY